MFQPVTVTGGLKNPNPTKIFKQCKFYVNLLGPKKCHCKKKLATKHQKADKLRLVMCVGVIGPRVTLMLSFGGVTATG